MTSRIKRYVGLTAAIGTAVVVASASYAQVATTLEQAELAGLSPETRAEIQTRM